MCSQLCQNPNMMELTVPLPLPESERTCAEGVAKELDLLTEMVLVHMVIVLAEIGR